MPLCKRQQRGARRIRFVGNVARISLITKEMLEETIRGVIREFARAKRIPDPTGDELTAALEAGVDELFDQEATLQSIDALPELVPSSDSESEADMHSFAEGTEHLPGYSGTYSRGYRRKKRAEALLERLPNGTPVPVRYKAERPETSTLLPADMSLLLMGL